jgi:hypothetical protein
MPAATNDVQNAAAVFIEPAAIAKTAEKRDDLNLAQTLLAKDEGCGNWQPTTGNCPFCALQ